MLRMCQEGGLPPVDCQRVLPPRDSKDGEGLGDSDLRRMKGRNGTGDSHKYKQYPLDWNATNVYAMELKIAEQAIYSAQIRLNEYEKMLGRHGQDERFRIAYVMKKLEKWGNEMSILYDYSHQNNTPYCCMSKFNSPGWYWSWAGRYVKNKYDNPLMFSVYRHIIYYQLILRKYIDIVYTLDQLRRMHQHIFDVYQETTETMDKMKKDMDQSKNAAKDMEKQKS